MAVASSAFYDALAENYHLMFEDWDASINRQADALGPLLERELGGGRLRILDCACGIGTQALGLAARGHEVTGTDASAPAVDRAGREAFWRGIPLNVAVADMCSLAEIGDEHFDAVIAADNAVPHLLLDDQICEAARAMFSRLRPGGLVLISIRDYDRLLDERPSVQGPAFFQDGAFRRIVHQVWHWMDERTYTLHLYITRETPKGWECGHYVAVYRALRRDELTAVLGEAGFTAVRWLTPADSGFYQPLVLANRPAP